MINVRNGIIAGAFAVLSVVAVAGWSRQPAAASTNPVALNTKGNTQPAYYDQNGQAVYAGVTASQPVSVNEPCLPANQAGESRSLGYEPVAYGASNPDHRYVSEQ
jgi:hypothetical protein